MSPIHNIRHWTHTHHMHWPHGHDMNKLMHNPAFWLIIALFFIMIAIITLGVLFGNGNTVTPYPPSTYPWPMYP